MNNLLSCIANTVLNWADLRYLSGPVLRRDVQVRRRVPPLAPQRQATKPVPSAETACESESNMSSCICQLE